MWALSFSTVLPGQHRSLAPRATTAIPSAPSSGAPQTVVDVTQGRRAPGHGRRSGAGAERAGVCFFLSTIFYIWADL